MCVLVVFAHNHISMWHNHISMATMQQALPGAFEAATTTTAPPPLTLSTSRTTVRALTLQNAAGAPIAGAAITATTTTTMTATAGTQEHPVQLHPLPQPQQVPGGAADSSSNLSQHSSLHAAQVWAAAAAAAAAGTGTSDTPGATAVANTLTDRESRVRVISVVEEGAAGGQQGQTLHA